MQIRVARNEAQRTPAEGAATEEVGRGRCRPRTIRPHQGGRVAEQGARQESVPEAEDVPETALRPPWDSTPAGERGAAVRARRLRGRPPRRRPGPALRHPPPASLVPPPRPVAERPDRQLLLQARAGAQLASQRGPEVLVPELLLLGVPGREGREGVLLQPSAEVDAPGQDRHIRSGLRDVPHECRRRTLGDGRHRPQSEGLPVF
mmetsp:Transcript_81660/g.231474  ORF Transcript_81660/g.231474 Transcript_81660/m.231474 type:complete len:205 (-) Transcript_81660:376-990(-)